MPVLSPPRAPAPLGHPAIDLLSQAQAGLVVAATATTAGQRYVAAHLAALRAGAAVLAGKARPGQTRGPRNVWTLLPRVAPELTEWAAFFAGSATKRAAVEAGLTRSVTSREADDLLRDAESFVKCTAEVLGLPQHAMRGVSSTLTPGA